MYSINLTQTKSLISLLPDKHILNLKQLSDNVVRIQLAHQTDEDSMRIVHANSKKFGTTHKQVYLTDVYLPIGSEQTDEPIVINNTRNWGSKTQITTDTGKVSLWNFFYNVITIIARANGMNVVDQEEED